MNPMVIPIILAGGVGSRLWPLSSEDFPKPFAIRTAEATTLLQATVQRVVCGKYTGKPLVVTNARYRHLLAAQALPAHAALYESVALNTAPAIVLAALYAAQARATGEGEPLLLVLPSDHVMTEEESFHRAVQQAMPWAEAGRIVTFGVVPEYPSSEYGYIEATASGPEGVYTIRHFHEKPAPAVAVDYCAAAQYYWNSGIFLAQATTLRREAQTHATEIYSACVAAMEDARHVGDECWPDAHAMAACPAASFDRAIMERTQQGVVVPVSMGWRDLGTHAALDAYRQSVQEKTCA